MSELSRRPRPVGAALRGGRLVPHHPDGPGGRAGATVADGDHLPDTDFADSTADLTRSNRSGNGAFNLMAGARQFTGQSLTQQGKRLRGSQNAPDGHHTRVIDVSGDETAGVAEIGCVLYDQSWDRFTTLAAAGIKAVRDASPTSKVEIHVIVDKDKLAKTMEFWHQYLTRVKAKGQNPDVLAISYYPEWHGTPEALDLNLNTIATTYPDYEIDIAETAYPASGGDGSPVPNSPYPRTIQGQADAIQRVFQAANDVVDNRGSGALVWEPAGYQPMFRAVPELANTWEAHASINVFNASRAKHIFQDTIYTATVVGAAPKLPSSIRMLTTANNTITSVPVRWKPLPPGGTDKPGEVTVTGTTDTGPVRAVIDVAPRVANRS